MTRKEQIENAAAAYSEKWYKEHDKPIEYSPLDEIKTENDFKAGAEWADKTTIEKACEWLREQKEMIGISFQEDFIEGFKQAMEK